MAAPNLITMQMIWEKLERNERLLHSILEKEAANNIMEYSISKAARLLNIGYDTLLEKIESGEIAARKVPNKKAKDGFSYRITHREIYRYQNQNKINHVEIVETYVESPEQLAKKLFGGSNEKG